MVRFGTGKLCGGSAPPAGTRALPRRHQPARAMLRGTYAHARIKRAADFGQSGKDTSQWWWLRSDRASLGRRLDRPASDEVGTDQWHMAVGKAFTRSASHPP